MSLAGENQPADGRPEVSDWDWDGSDDEHESPLSAYTREVTRAVNFWFKAVDTALDLVAKRLI